MFHAELSKNFRRSIVGTAMFNGNPSNNTHSHMHAQVPGLVYVAPGSGLSPEEMYGYPMQIPMGQSPLPYHNHPVSISPSPTIPTNHGNNNNNDGRKSPSIGDLSHNLSHRHTSSSHTLSHTPLPSHTLSHTHPLTLTYPLTHTLLPYHTPSYPSF